MRNESVHVVRCLSDFIADGIDVVLIDNGSTDDTVAKARRFLGKGLRAIERLPWRGAFSLSEQLELKARIALEAPYRWIIHADADERFETPAEFGSLRDALGAAGAAGYNCVNFKQFVFVPVLDEDFAFDGYADAMRTYYFFEPRHPYFMRAWKRELAVHLPHNAGHILEGPEVRLCPTDFVVRHYIALSERHAAEKYCDRTFSEHDMARGWHKNRHAIPISAFRLEPRHELRSLAAPQSRDYDAGAPQRTHYWEWLRESWNGSGALAARPA
ncbi:MAG TPA: hypothetical protein VGC96_11315 [Candidatus Elarobacter sp.]